MVSRFLEAVGREFIDIITWDDPAPTDLVYRYPRVDAEIKQGAQLVVRPGQVAVFIDQGRVADVFGPGRHVLQTANLPVLSTLRGWKYGFDSPFKADVLFVQTIQFAPIKWGSKTPILVQDAELGTVRLRAYGICVVAVADPRVVIEQVAGAGQRMQIDELRDRFRDTIAAALNAVLGVPGRRVAELAATLPRLAEQRQAALQAPFGALGFRLAQFTIESVTLPEVVSAAVDRQAAVRVAGGIAAYTQVQRADAIKAAAEQGLAGGMVGLGVGMLLQQQAAGAVAAVGVRAPPRALPTRPPPLPASVGRELAWRVVRADQASPFNGQHDLLESAVRQYIQAQQLQGHDLAWTVGAANWIPLREAAAFASLFAPPPVPPPVPPAGAA